MMAEPLGRLAEALAEKFLKRRGYQILERNFRCRFGEIDLVAKEGGELVFVEVKCRRSTTFGFPQEQIPWEKRKRLGKLAQFYLKRCRRDVAFRIDVVAILVGQRGAILSVEMIQNAITSSA